MAACKVICISGSYGVLHSLALPTSAGSARWSVGHSEPPKAAERSEERSPQLKSTQAHSGKLKASFALRDEAAGGHGVTIGTEPLHRITSLARQTFENRLVRKCL